jgi:hypothetical protein
MAFANGVAGRIPAETNALRVEKIARNGHPTTETRNRRHAATNDATIRNSWQQQSCLKDLAPRQDRI